MRQPDRAVVLLTATSWISPEVARRRACRPGMFDMSTMKWREYPHYSTGLSRRKASETSGRAPMRPNWRCIAGQSATDRSMSFNRRQTVNR